MDYVQPTLLAGPDLNADGDADVVLCAKGAVDGEYDAAIWVFSDPSNGTRDITDAEVRVDTWTDQYHTKAEILDINGDSYPDLVVSDAYQGGTGYREGSGRVNLLLGPLSGTYDAVEDADGWLEGSIEPFESCETDGCEHPGSLFGFTLENAGDVDNDGFEDLLVGAPGFEHDTSTNMKGPGAVYLFRGGGGL
ncbi:MAG: hypothetical protein GY913_36290 [Proteobacteria bacterium]|nr:hypothetical protein [Pseudomonadota bacterium]